MHGGRRWVAEVAIALICALLITVVTPVDGSASPPGFHVSNGRLLDGYGNDFIMRGVNHPHSWFEAEIGSLDDIKAAGANTARIVLSNGARYKRTDADSLANVIQRCRRVRLVCVLEVHDTTGYPESTGSISLDDAVDYWLEMQPVLAGTESFVLVNIGNEPFGNQTPGDWRWSTEAAITRLRSGGYEHTLMVDAPNWGQDWTFTMRDNAATVLEADPQLNIVFDVHMYGVFDTAAKVRSYLETFVRNDLALVVGEFGIMHTDGNPDVGAILHWTAMYGIGTLAWSWSGNTDPVEPLNMVKDFDPLLRTTWGNQVLTGALSVASPAREASIFSSPAVIAPPLLAQPPEEFPVAPPATRVRLSRFEVESGVWNGLELTVPEAGSSGAGYLTGFDARGDSVTVTVDVESAGAYELVFGYRAPFGDKTQNLILNGTERHAFTFEESPSFTSSSAGEFELLQGSNRLMIQHDWGWMDLDYVEVWVQQ